MIIKVLVGIFAIIGLVACVVFLYVFLHDRKNTQNISTEDRIAEQQKLYAELMNQQCVQKLAEKYHPALISRYYIGSAFKSDKEVDFKLRQEMLDFLAEHKMDCSR